MKLWKLLSKWWKQLWCRKHDKAYHTHAELYDANPPHNRMRYAILQRPVCVKCGKDLGKWRIIKDNLSKSQAARFMRASERQMHRDFGA